MYGNPINFSATVNQTAATGSVEFLQGGELLGVAALNAGSATLTLNQIPGTGQYLQVETYGNITAAYRGDNNIRWQRFNAGAPRVTVTQRTEVWRVGPALIMESH